MIRTRFAPSPTGYLHVGSLRTVIYAYLFAKQNKGEFILRIEDTDKTREVPGALESLIKTLDNLGFTFDEGPILKNNKIVQHGKHGPYIQSQRLEIYQEHVNKLIKDGQAYYCFCSEERLEKMREEQIAQKKAPKYDGFCRKFSLEEIQEKLDKKEPYVIRLKVPSDQTVSFNDIIRGEVKFSSNDIDDQVLLKSDGFPTYHLANVVDDHLMKISHVIRGEEWLSSTPKHILLYQAFGWTAPQFAHMSLLLNPDKTKLSKRQGDVAVEDYLKKGYLKEALINFIATIGWTEGSGSEQEIYSLKELIKKFDLSRINKAGAIFNLEKLDWLNGYYLRKMKTEELVKLCQPYLSQIKDEDLLDKIVTIEQERLKKISDIGQNIEFFYQDRIDYEPELLIWKKATKEQTLENLVKLEDFLLGLDKKDFATVKNLEEKTLAWINQNGYGVGDLLWPMRVALSGLKNSPSPFEIAWVLGREKTLERINLAQKKLK